MQKSVAPQSTSFPLQQQAQPLMGLPQGSLSLQSLPFHQGLKVTYLSMSALLFEWKSTGIRSHEINSWFLKIKVNKENTLSRVMNQNKKLSPSACVIKRQNEAWGSHWYTQIPVYFSQDQWEDNRNVEKILKYFNLSCQP